MTREEAIAILQDKHDECKAFYDLAAHPEDAYHGTKEYMEALQMALAALRGPTREQVEKSWAGCEYCEKHKINLCGRPLTDEAVDILLKRLEALHENDH